MEPIFGPDLCSKTRCPIHRSRETRLPGKLTIPNIRIDFLFIIKTCEYVSTRMLPEAILFSKVHFSKCSKPRGIAFYDRCSLRRATVANGYSADIRIGLLVRQVRSCLPKDPRTSCYSPIRYRTEALPYSHRFENQTPIRYPPCL